MKEFYATVFASPINKQILDARVTIFLPHIYAENVEQAEEYAKAMVFATKLVPDGFGLDKYGHQVIATERKKGG